MNSADKSISLIDTALRRRFCFKEIEPNLDLVKDITLRKILKQLNEELLDEFDSTDLLIGHSYFIGKNIEDLADIFNDNIIPLLYEYFYDNRKKVINIVNKIIENTDFEICNKKFGRISLKKKG